MSGWSGIHFSHECSGIINCGQAQYVCFSVKQNILRAESLHLFEWTARGGVKSAESFGASM